MSNKPIRHMSINAPLKGQCDLDHFVRFIFAPQYKEVSHDWSKYEVHTNILLYKNTEDLTFFENMDKKLRYICPGAIGKILFVRKD